jgi:hypothetical protein
MEVSISYCVAAILEVESFCRVVAGSGQVHVVSREGVVLVDEDHYG